jgi:hypothetical protein
MKIYVAGKMTGVPYYNYPLFDHIKGQLEREGHEVTTPADLNRKYENYDPAGLPQDTDWNKWPLQANRELILIRDIMAVCKSDKVVLISGWQTSRGATIEMLCAEWLGKEVEEL